MITTTTRLLRTNRSPIPAIRRSFQSHQQQQQQQSEPTNSQYTVSRSEIDHFNKLGSTWWNEHGAFGLLHRMNPVRVQFIKERLLYDVSPPTTRTITNDRNQSLEEESISDRQSSHDFLAGKRVLDVGCGGGIFSEVLARLGAKVLGIDAAEDSINAARLHAQSDPLLNLHGPQSNSNSEPNLLYRHCSVESLLEADQSEHRGKYDIVCAMEVIEHVENPAGFLTALTELTKPGGHIILSTISRTPLSRFLTITLAESQLPIIGIVPAGTHTYNKYIKPDELVEFFRGHDHHQLGWAQSHERSDLEVRGCFYDPLASKWILFNRDAFYAEWCNYFFGVKKPL
ncbi:hypothetical protein MJO28_002876 [Puccinia striiformis f. sp. tritici]|uniref:Ubiquinone biosynthesis O-methyltransferase, mitochondrial n=4 Tax=Puccinia striiformis TaxID=27350 RepID=A0A0L0VJ11_9BASI|nr:hypothetical protein Pst134EA_005178 [Puccinia striiformis f. sp. tritici]KAI9619911.1 hypothetical protein H4Q26_013888 [Puccinia striiformis f. sp. tritici PST-130]KNE99275.1 3-demethylubiquinone-9 3-O-methyltransferase [Puccinia striiformis f. sp. tritici PST-78]POV99379.1 hypothetical protein PSTT_13839 [Puccinia striiformis]KAH9462340.1 hypothetical protein Pst134EB_006242 [Puccinia striiformis f. sp. tritici]KAH9471271.1 hypothetical protein Pst134EA_005178 [Puccinia striiformis f. sp